MPVALDVAVLAAEGEEHEILVTGVPEVTRGRRLDVDSAAWAELERLAIDLEAGAARVDEVEASSWRSWKWLNHSVPAGKTRPFAPNAVIPSAGRSLRKTPGPSSSSDVTR